MIKRSDSETPHKGVVSLSGGLRHTDETKGLQGAIFDVFPATDPDASPLATSWSGTGYSSRYSRSDGTHMANQHARAALAPQATPARRLDYDRLDELLGFRLRMAHIALYRDFMSSLAQVQVTQRQVAVLWLVGANPGLSQGELAAALAMDSATMVAVIDRLETEGRIVRRQSEADRRRRELHLTPAGVKALKSAKAAIARLERRMASSLSEGEWTSLLTVLGKLAGLP